MTGLEPARYGFGGRYSAAELHRYEVCSCLCTVHHVRRRVLPYATSMSMYIVSFKIFYSVPSGRVELPASRLEGACSSAELQGRVVQI